MRPDEILIAVEKDLKRFAESQPGVRARVQTATDPWHVLELLATGPNGRLIVVNWDGDTNISEFPQVAINEERLEVIVGHNLGLTSDPGATLTRGTEERPGLMRFMYEVRQRVRRLTLDPENTSTCFEYKGTEPMTMPDGIPLAAFKARFEITVSGDEPGKSPPWTEAQ